MPRGAAGVEPAPLRVTTKQAVGRVGQLRLGQHRATGVVGGVEAWLPVHRGPANVRE